VKELQMPDDERDPDESGEAQRQQDDRANEIRRQIEDLKSVQDGSEDEDAAARKPGESDKEYLERLERRMRDQSHKRNSQE
jgi:hypothetical protein